MCMGHVGFCVCLLCGYNCGILSVACKVLLYPLLPCSCVPCMPPYVNGCQHAPASRNPICVTFEPAWGKQKTHITPKRVNAISVRPSSLRIPWGSIYSRDRKKRSHPMLPLSIGNRGTNIRHDIHTPPSSVLFFGTMGGISRIDEGGLAYTGTRLESQAWMGITFIRRRRKYANTATSSECHESI